MEDYRGNRFEPSAKFEDSTLDKKKKNKSNARTRFPIAEVAKLESEKQISADRRNPSAIEAALANLAAKRRAENDKSGKAEQESAHVKPRHEAGRPGINETVEAGTSDATELDDESNQEDNHEYEQLKRHDLDATVLSGGEVVIDLKGDHPIEERVVPLATEAAESVEPDVDDAAEEQIRPELSAVEQQVRSEAPEAEEPDPSIITPPLPVQPPLAPPMPRTQSNQPPVGVHPNTMFTMPNPNQTGTVAPSPNALVPPNPNFSNLNVPNPNTVYLQQQTAANPNVSPTTGNVQTQQDIDDAEYYGRKAGVGQGLVTGLFVGGVYEHFKHRRREKKAEKRFKQQAKKLELEQANQRFAQQEQADTASAQERRLRAAETRASESETKIAALENRPNAVPVKAAEVPKPNADRIAPVPEVAEKLEIAEGHHLETSAWHAIEIDNKTGKAVETPTFAYGQEYYRERAQENAPASQRNAAAGGLAMAVVTGSNAADSGGASNLPPIIPDATMQGQPPSREDLSRMQKLNNVKDSFSTAPIWPWAVALVVIIVILAMVLH